MKLRGFIQAVLAAGLFGASTPFAKSLLADLQANQLAGLLYLGAALGLGPIVCWRFRKGETVFPRDTRNRKRLLGAVVFGGIVGPVLLMKGLQISAAASVSMWLNLETVATAVLALLLFREHLGKWTWLGNLGVLLAGLLLSYDQGWAGWLGFACIAGAAISWGLDNNFTALIDGISPEDSTFWKGLIAGTTNLAIGLILAPLAFGWTWLWALVVGCLSYGASIALYIRAAHNLGATRSQMIFAAAPFFGVVMSVVWLSESLSTYQLAAAAILAGAIALMFLDQHEHEHVHEPMEHEHEHRHDDDHHNHAHEGLPPGTRHTHVHTHERQVHSHPHWPDLHHRHEHAGED